MKNKNQTKTVSTPQTKTKTAPKPIQNKASLKKKREYLFFKFIAQKPQLLDLAIVLSCCLLAYIGIRYYYPYPLTMSDSGGYVEAAVKDIFYVYRPFGYSYFLQILHSITTNIHSIFIVQMFLLFLATWFLAITVKYFYKPQKKWLWYIALLFLIFTPTSFIMANWIMSDLLFSVQIYFIVALFIFIIKRKSWIATILYILVLFTALHVRYSAIIFPFILIPFFFMKKGKLRWVITLLSIVVFFVFYSQIRNSMKKAVKMEQFSTGFDGWTYASNVINILPHIDLKEEDLKNPKLKALHSFIMEDIDIIKDVIDSRQTLVFFMWNNKLPLKQYHAKTRQKNNAQYLPTYVKLGSGIYKDYAVYIMTHYPFSYLRYYYLPNMKQTFYPHDECFTYKIRRDKIIYEYYNIDEENAMEAKYEIIKNPTYRSTIKILHLTMWIAIISIGITAIVRRKKVVFSTDDKIVFWGLFSFAAIYYASNIFAAPMEIRYTISMHSIQFIFCYLLLNKLFANEKHETTEKLASDKKGFFLSKKAKIISLSAISIIVLSVGVYFIIPNKSQNNQQETIEISKETNDQKLKDYIEACEFCKDNLSDSILVITRKPEIFYEFSGNKKAMMFSWDAEPDSIMSYLRETQATHIILDDRYRHAYLTLYPTVQKYPEKFKVLKAIGKMDTVANQNVTYVLEFNDEWGYYGERIDGKKTGEGYEILQDGRKYVGHFEENTFNGYGTLYDKDGNVILKGKWHNGALVSAE